MTPHQRKKVYKNTQLVSNRLINPPPKSIKYSHLDNLNIKKKKYNTHVHIINDDTINTAIRLKDLGLNPLVLNMSDWHIPGGLVKGGVGTQEENIFRRSNYFKTLITDFYPMENIEIVYSPNVTVFKTDEATGYKLMNNNRLISFMATPALCMPKCNSDFTKMLDKDEINSTISKIRMMFNTAHKNNHDSLVLGAWGCGAYGNPPKYISYLFKKVIDEYDGYFRMVVFGILNDNHGDNNFEIFEKKLNQ